MTLDELRAFMVLTGAKQRESYFSDGNYEYRGPDGTIAIDVYIHDAYFHLHVFVTGQTPQFYTDLEAGALYLKDRVTKLRREWYG